MVIFYISQIQSMMTTYLLYRSSKSTTKLGTSGQNGVIWDDYINKLFIEGITIRNSVDSLKWGGHSIQGHISMKEIYHNFLIQRSLGLRDSSGQYGHGICF